MRDQETKPLSPATLAILLALVDGEQHGYAIMKAVEQQPAGLRLGAGTLYAALQRLVNDGWISESSRRPGPADDPRRRYYHLTRLGRRGAQVELARLADIVATAEARSLLRGFRRSELAGESR